MIKDTNNYHVLVIEDNPGDLLLIEDYLGEQIEKPLIEVAKDFNEAKLLLEKDNRFDIILLDLTLPDKSGGELISEIIKISGDIPIIVLTGFTDMEFSIQSISLGVSDYLLKNDLNASSLYKSILYCLERKKRVTELMESEKRYSELFRLNPQPILIFDIDTFRFVQVNNAAVLLYGYSLEEFNKITVFELRSDEDNRRLRQSLKENLHNNQTVHRKSKHFTKSGRMLDVEIQATFIVINNKKYRMVIITDVTEKNRVDQQITKAIIKTQENERYEIGGELHDNICQILASTHISLGVLSKSVDNRGLELFNQCRNYISLATQEIRNLSHRLAPAFFNDSTLEEAFNILLKNINIENKYEISVYFDPSIQKLNINHDLQLNLYRILQEQLRNILKYAKCKRIEIDLIQHNNYLKMRVSDDGIGFDVHAVKGGIGISNMRRRTELFEGKFELLSSPGEGCQLIISIPLKAENLNSKTLQKISTTSVLQK
ncbi:MAG: PAS domain S-box protein [Ginsengibacter sp.]